ncbi:MAG: helix-turn-helix transcriptional regulator [Pseudomonadota bacterium]
MSDTGIQNRSPEAPALLGDRIRLARRARGLSQAELAIRLGVSQPAVANWESGAHDPRHVILGKLAKTLEVSRAWLAQGGEEESGPGRLAASLYLRRPLIHAPIIAMEDAERVAHDPMFDPREAAKDFIPVTSSSTRLFAVFADDEAVNLAFPKDTIVVVDYGERTPAADAFFLAAPAGRPMLRLWRPGPDRLEPYSSDPTHPTYYVDTPDCIIGRAKVSIRLL